VPRAASQPDLAVSAALAARQLDVAPRTIERMREWGLLPTRNQHGLGQGAGSVAKIAADEVDRAAFANQLLMRHGSYAHATLGMFVDGRYTVTKDRLEKAYAASLSGVQRLIDRHAGGASDHRSAAVAAAEWLARQICKRRRFRTLRKRLLSLQPHGMGVREALEWAATDMVLLLVRGRADSSQGLRDMLAVTGVADALNDPATGDRREPLETEALEQLSPYLSLTALNATVRSTPLDELERARDFAKTFRTFAVTYGMLLKRNFGVGAGFVWLFTGAASDMTVAYATPALVVLLRQHPERTQEWLEHMKLSIPVLAQDPGSIGPKLR